MRFLQNKISRPAVAVTAVVGVGVLLWALFPISVPVGPHVANIRIFKRYDSLVPMLAPHVSPKHDMRVNGKLYRNVKFIEKGYLNIPEGNAIMFVQYPWEPEERVVVKYLDGRPDFIFLDNNFYGSFDSRSISLVSFSPERIVIDDKGFAATKYIFDFASGIISSQPINNDVGR